MNIIKYFVATVISITSIMSPINAAAAGPNNPGSGGNGLRISPVKSSVTVNPGSSRIVNISVTNVTTEPAVIQGVVNDFYAKKDESGSPAVILDPQAYSSSHSLKRFAKPLGKYSLNPGQTITVPVEINIPANAAGGGYFGAARFYPAAVASTPKSNVSLLSSVGSLILVKVPGDLKELMNLKSFTVAQDGEVGTFFTSNKNLSSVIRIENKGNVHEQPFGKLVVRDRSGKIVFEKEINNQASPNSVLPDSTRKFNIPIDNIKTVGKYKVEGAFGYGASGQLLTGTTSFYYIPKIVIIGAIILIALILFLIFGLPKVIRTYNKRVVRNARRR